MDPFTPRTSFKGRCVRNRAQKRKSRAWLKEHLLRFEIIVHQLRQSKHDKTNPNDPQMVVLVTITFAPLQLLLAVATEAVDSASVLLTSSAGTHVRLVFQCIITRIQFSSKGKGFGHAEELLEIKMVCNSSCLDRFEAARNFQE